MAIDPINWRREMKKFIGTELLTLKSEIANLRTDLKNSTPSDKTSTNDKEISALKNEIANLRADFNSLTELVKIITANQMLANVEREILQPLKDIPAETKISKDEVIEDNHDEVFTKVCEILANNLNWDEDNIDTFDDVNSYVYDDDFAEAISDMESEFGIEIPYDVYTEFSFVSDIVNYINYKAYGIDNTGEYEDDEEDNLYSNNYSYSSYESDYDSHDARTVTTIENRTGIHARPASLFVQTASKFKSKIQIKAKGKTVDAKSILMLMSMGLTKGTEITITADGPDAFDAVYTLKKLVDDKFGED